MMFYMATRYEGESGDPDLELVDYTGTDGPIFGKLSTLIEWNAEDPVDDFERNRNDVVYSYQGNRNPFIDHPEFVDAIYNPEEDTTSTGTYILAEEQQIIVYPNPATNYINIDAPDNYSFEIYSIIGEKMVDTKDKQVDISYFDKGIYFIVIKNEKGRSVKCEKILKR